MQLRHWLKKVHLILALVAALPLVVASATGAALVFFAPTEYWLNRHAIDVPIKDQRLPLSGLLTTMVLARPDLTFRGVSIAEEKDRALQFWAVDKQENWWSFYVDPYSGKMQPGRQVQEFSWRNIVRWTTDLHYSLRAGETGATIVGSATIVLLCLVITGLILWLPRKLRNLPDRFKVNLSRHWRKNAYQWHINLGFYFSSALLVIALSGIAMAFRPQVATIVYAITGSTPPAKDPLAPPEAGKAFLSLDEQLAAALTYVDQTFHRHPWPRYIAFAGEGSAITTFYFQEIHDLYEVSGYEIAVHAQSGAILHSQVPMTRNLGDKVLAWVSAVHFGSWGDAFAAWFGYVTRILWIFAALMPLFLVITGLTMWRKPVFYRKWKQKLLT